MTRRQLSTAFTLLLGLLLAFLRIAGATPATARPPHSPPGGASDLNSGITYQGYLQENAIPVEGSCDLTFALYDAESNANRLGATEIEADVMVSQGRFTVQLNEAAQFGETAFDGAARWLEIAVRCPAAQGEFTTLTPRQPLTASPHALSLRPGATISGTASAGILNLANNGGDGLVVDLVSGNGLRVGSAGTSGVLVSDAAGAGFGVVSAGQHGVYVNQAGSPSSSNHTGLNTGFQVAGSEGYGLFVGRSDWHGVYIGSSGADGLLVAAAEYDGMRVVRAGNPTTTIFSGAAIRSGFEVEGAEGNGLFVGRADMDGISVVSAGDDGLEVNQATDLAAYFNGNVQITGSCSGCTLTTFGVNTSQKPLAPATIVSLRAAVAPSLELTGVPVLMEVGPASMGESLIGVVAGRAELENEDGEQVRLLPREGPAAPGDYVTIIIYGLAQVWASTAETPIMAGERLAVTGEGIARRLQTIEIEGVRLAEDSPGIGIALQDLNVSEEGLIWVLVNPH